MSGRTLALVLLTLTLYANAPSLVAEFVYEDTSAVLETAGAPIAWSRTRALTRASYQFDHWLGGGQPWAYHATSLGLHLTNGFLIYRIASLLAPLTAAVPALAAAVFLLHPLQTESVDYAAGRTEVLSTMFALVAVWLMMRTYGMPRVGEVATIVLALIAAMWTKESAVCAIGLVTLVAFMRWGPSSPTEARYWVAITILAVVAAVPLAATVVRHEYLVTSDLSPWPYAALQAKALWRMLLIVPTLMGQTVDHDFNPGAWDGALLALLLLALSTAAVCWVAGSLDGVIAFGIGWMAVALALRFVMRIPEVVNEHQLYLFMGGMSIVLGRILAPLFEPQRRQLEAA